MTVSGPGEAGVFYEEAGGTLFCGDLLTHLGDPEPLTGGDTSASKKENVTGSPRRF